MAEIKIQVPEWMADFIGWVGEQDQDRIRSLVRERLAEIKEQNEVSKESHVDEGFKWDKVLEPNDGVEQWKHGGDCNFCRKASYCMKKCRPNRLLKKIITPFLYQMYLDENPEASLKKASGMDSETLMKQLGVLQ